MLRICSLKLSPRCRQKGNWKGHWTYCGACRYFKGRQDGTDWKLNNRAKDRDNHKTWMKKARKENQWFGKIEDAKRHIRRAIKTELWPTSMHTLIRASYSEFKERMISRFVGNMTWENHGIIWSVDHIVPIANFKIDSEDKMMDCFRLENLQPMYERANMWKKCEIYN
jgi:hypothetical protein